MSKEHPPTLLLYGDKDTDAPYEQSVIMANELQQNGVAHKLITMAGGGHGFDFQIKEKPDVSAAFDDVIALLKSPHCFGAPGPLAWTQS